MITHTHTHALSAHTHTTRQSDVRTECQHPEALTHTTVQYNARIKKPLMSTPVYASQVSTSLLETDPRTQSLERGTGHRTTNTDRVPAGGTKPNLRFLCALESLGPRKGLFWKLGELNGVQPSVISTPFLLCHEKGIKRDGLI